MSSATYLHTTFFSCCHFGTACCNINRLQDPSINFRQSACDINGLKDVLQQEHESSCGIDDIISEGKELAEKLEIDEPRVRREKVIPGEDAQDAGLTATKDLRRKMNACLDRFLSELDQRFQCSMTLIKIQVFVRREKGQLELYQFDSWKSVRHSQKPFQKLMAMSSIFEITDNMFVLPLMRDYGNYILTEIIIH